MSDMITFEKSTEQHVAIELEIHNSNRFFNRISKDREQFEAEEIREEIRKAEEFGAERFLIRHGDRYVGVIEYLMRNLNDGQTWLGLLVIHQAYHSQGYGAQALERFYEIMRKREVKTFRIGVLADNEPAHAFWSKQGFRRLEGKKEADGKPVAVYEKNVPHA